MCICECKYVRVTNYTAQPECTDMTIGEVCTWDAFHKLDNVVQTQVQQACKGGHMLHSERGYECMKCLRNDHCPREKACYDNECHRKLW